jgi:hypothetical protein
MLSRRLGLNAHFAAVDGVITQFFLYTEKLVVFCDTIRAA